MSIYLVYLPRPMCSQPCLPPQANVFTTSIGSTIKYVDCSIRRPGSVAAVIDGKDVCACPPGWPNVLFNRY